MYQTNNELGPAFIAVDLRHNKGSVGGVMVYT